ncbi:MAG: hypothetical protein INR71_03380 [Terriglobus roseus]|nr:hypothetical protein [Terriglobus roseus]
MPASRASLPDARSFAAPRPVPQPCWCLSFSTEPSRQAARQTDPSFFCGTVQKGQKSRTLDKLCQRRLAARGNCVSRVTLHGAAVNLFSPHTHTFTLRRDPLPPRPRLSRQAGSPGSTKTASHVVFAHPSTAGRCTVRFDVRPAAVGSFHQALYNCCAA